ncbi:SGNH/GDSL hydrolase family protein [Pseudomonas sp. NBRC 111125]|uniref:SGNH/GDSL hydrolase family protein n=1 Tax=Pseudomonas sp. NBRC 111125 TaxID=1661040 RepID=UPI000761B3CD|nr:SGNH/GDSL hydrolase family protein [Pseudomonas sp. NBRC 111125]
MELKNFFAQDDAGNILAGAVCYLYTRGTESLVTGLLKANGTPLHNPFSTDAAGMAQFAAPNGIYDLRVVFGKRDNRIQVQCNDVTDTQAAADAAADRSELARDAAGVAAGLKNSISEGLQSTTNGQRFVVSAVGDESLVVYENRAGVAVEINSYPSTKVLKDQAALIAGTSNTGSFLSVLNDEREELATFTEKSLATPSFAVTADIDATSLGDDEYGALVHGNSQGFRLGNMEFEATERPGLRILNDEREVVVDLSKPLQAPVQPPVLPFEGGLLFHPTIAVPENGEVSIYVNNMMAYRDRSTSVVASLASVGTGAISEGTVLQLDAARFGSSAALHLRPVDSPDSRLSMPVKVLKVPVQSPVRPVKVLLIGDSISNRQGAQLLKAYLQKLGFAATMIGTLPGSGSPTNNSDDSGELGEGREGWETGDFTADVIDRLRVVEPGGEAAYMALGKVDKQRINPFVRAATGSDPAEIVRNGYVFDPAFYQSRFGLETPDVVISALGTNNVRDLGAETIAERTYADDMLMYRQILAAWPNARIVRSLPGTAYSTQRNQLWTSHYTPMIRAMRRAVADFGDSKVYMAPTWALVSSEAGYPLPTGTADQDGFLPGKFLNLIHPEDAGRYGLYEVLANYVAAAALSL